MYSVQGNEVREGDKVVETCRSHGEAVKAAQARTTPTASVGMKPTAHLAVAFDFEDADTFDSIVDTDAAMAADVAAEPDPAVVSELMGRSEAAIVEAHTEQVRAKQVDHDFEHSGARFPAGSWVLVDAGNHVHAMTDADFTAAYKPAKKATKKSAGKAGKGDNPAAG